MDINDSKIRRNRILSAVIETYIKSANQVSSRYIAKRYNFRLSPATIRNEMAELEEMGYLTHPHTSAGRIPTDKGYRYYVDELMNIQKLTKDEVDNIHSNFELKFKVLENVIEITSNLLSGLSRQTSLILYPKLDKSTFKHVELILLKERKILIVLMTNTGIVKNSITEIEEDIITHAQLQKISNFLNYELYDMPLSQIKDHLGSKLIQEKDIMYRIFKDTIDIFKLIFKNIHEDKIMLEGLDHILENPEFENLEKSRIILKLLGQKKDIVGLLKQSLESNSMRVYIGKELPLNMLDDCSIITACYKISNQPIGCIGILGPRRMEYPRVISIVKYISEYISDILTELER